MKSLGSDNHSGIQKDILQSFLAVNDMHTPSYGMDPVTEKATEIFQTHFGNPSEVCFVMNGTAANVIALQCIVKSYEAVIVSDCAHLHLDECGAPEFHLGSKVWAAPTVDGKIQITQNLKDYVSRRGDQHYPQAKVLSITQPTELGTVYTLEEIKTLTDWAHANGLLVHMDGARIANAVMHLKTTFKAMTRDVGVDIVSFGGTKNGLWAAEAIVALNKTKDDALGKNLKFYRKQSLHLQSKMRFISQQFITYLESDLWKKIAEHSLSEAQFLKEALKEFPQIKICYPVESNALFVQLPKEWIKPLREKHFFYIWDEDTRMARWMVNHDWTREDSKGLIGLLKEIQQRTVAKE